MLNVTVGADPEVFVRDDTGIQSAIGLIGGSKDAPLIVPCGGLQEDNVLAEFNIDPANSEREFVQNIKTVMQSLGKKVAPMKFDVLSSHQFTPQFLREAGEQAMVFGCDPDYNAWTGGKNETPNPYTTLRTAGGHIHVGFDVDEDDMDTRSSIIKMMDFYLGVPSVLLDNDNERRELYGKAGAFRPKMYGVEYRTLSNFWIKNDNYMKWAYNQAVAAVNDVGLLPSFLKKFDENVVQTTINDSDKDKAVEIIKELDINMDMED